MLQIHSTVTATTIIALYFLVFYISAMLFPSEFLIDLSSIHVRVGITILSILLLGLFIRESLIKNPIKFALLTTGIMYIPIGVFLVLIGLLPASVTLNDAFMDNPVAQERRSMQYVFTKRIPTAVKHATVQGITIFAIASLVRFSNEKFESRK